MAATKQTYTVKKAFPHKGRKRRPGDTVEMHPRQAKYLVGTFLEHPAPKASKGNQKTGGKS